ncbi:hypothetical protein ILYODFUR_022288 [Ilyodon furcidens]|uniref:Uncharacterized protein n=1 Tax=Ilyodon furcidens TaxID=33524 RepID=A0ABV0SRU3_9TELE
MNISGHGGGVMGRYLGMCACDGCMLHPRDLHSAHTYRTHTHTHTYIHTYMYSALQQYSYSLGFLKYLMDSKLFSSRIPLHSAPSILPAFLSLLCKSKQHHAATTMFHLGEGVFMLISGVSFTSHITFCM